MDDKTKEAIQLTQAQMAELAAHNAAMRSALHALVGIACDGRKDRALADTLSRLLPVMTTACWLPMEYAPRNRECDLLLRLQGGTVVMGNWDKYADSWTYDDGRTCEPTGWLITPNPTEVLR